MYFPFLLIYNLLASCYDKVKVMELTKMHNYVANGSYFGVKVGALFCLNLLTEKSISIMVMGFTLLLKS